MDTLQSCLPSRCTGRPPRMFISELSPVRSHSALCLDILAGLGCCSDICSWFTSNCIQIVVGAACLPDCLSSGTGLTSPPSGRTHPQGVVAEVLAVAS